MEEKSQSRSAPMPITPDQKTILINNIKYSYLIEKTELEKEESIRIKLFSPEKYSNYFFTYESQVSKIVKDIKFLSLCEDSEEMINSLKEIFVQGNANVEEKEGKYFLELKLVGIAKKCVIELIKNEEKVSKPGESKSEMEEKINRLEKNYEVLLTKIEEIKNMKENMIKKNEFKNMLKEALLDEEIEEIIFAKYNLKKIGSEKNQIIEKNTIKEEDININKELKEEVKEIKKDIKELNEMKNILKENKINENNYIVMKVKIEPNDVNKDIRLLNQTKIYKYNCNFERDDFETIIDDKSVSIKYKNKHGDFKYDEASQNCKIAQLIEHELSTEYYFYWNFSSSGIHTVKIIFKKKLNDCSFMFNNCSNIIEIDFGKIDFTLSTSFDYMFCNCSNLEKLDVSNFNTENSKSFQCMFFDCSKLKEIDVSEFKTQFCKNIEDMFKNCRSLESIDMLKWNINSLEFVNGLFSGCSKLKIIKINLYNKRFYKNVRCFFYKKIEEVEPSDIFDGLPKGGSFVWKKGKNCDKILKYLPVSWNRTQE